MEILDKSLEFLFTNLRMPSFNFLLVIAKFVWNSIKLQGDSRDKSSET
jgi:hypothetical protein